tara:strand:- start:6 stop:1019 length:1014 start_codon:yes stop_codon:yes gene_type:complete
MNVLLTGGMGYIGSHVALSLLNKHHKVVIIDNLSNSDASVLDRICSIEKNDLIFIPGDILDTALVEETIGKNEIDAVIHLAGLKAVGESTVDPLKYYNNNVVGTISLVQAMLHNDIGNIVFSSSATVYGNPQYLPIDESHPTQPHNPYGNSKLFIENILNDVAKSNKNWNVVNLRYFNPVGSHKSGLIGDNPKGIPNNLMPFIDRVASQDQPILKIFGNDYDTPDGTGIRDYIHIEDLSEAHVLSLNLLSSNKHESPDNTYTFNLGTGKGYSVMEIVSTYQSVNNISIPYEIVSRREGDIACCYADPTRANSILNWKAKRTLEDMCSSSWNYKKLNL